MSYRPVSEGCGRCLRYSLIIFNILVLIFGAALLGVGIYFLVSDYGSQHVSRVLGTDLYEVSSYLMIVTGSIIVIIALIGCCGAIMESKCLLILYFSFLIILLIILVALVILGFVFEDKLRGGVISVATETLILKYGVNLNHMQNRLVTDTWDLFQTQLDCCGVVGHINSTQSWAVYKMASQWYKSFDERVPYVPESCCKNIMLKTCTGETFSNGPPTYGPPVTPNMTKNPYLKMKGCFNEMEIILVQNAVIIIAIALATIVVILFGAIFSMALFCTLRREY